MIQQRLQEALHPVTVRLRVLKAAQLLALAWLLAAGVSLALWGLSHWVSLPASWLLAGSLSVAFVLSAAAVTLGLLAARDPRSVARRIEATYPELQCGLLAAVEQTPLLPQGRFSYLQAHVIQEALLHAHQHPWSAAVPARRLALAAAANLPGLLLLAGMLVALAWQSAGRPGGTQGLAAALRPSGGGFSMTIEPGDTQVERGSSLLVLARIKGPMPPEATLVVRDAAGGQTRLPMTISLEDPLLGARIPVVDAPLEYYVEAGHTRSPRYRVEVFEYPRLVRADAHLEFPAYTAQPPRQVSDVRTLSVVEGTRVTLRLTLNKPVATAELTEPGQPPLALVAAPAQAAVYEGVLTAERTRRLKLHLVDEAGRTNVQVPQLTIQVVPNQPAQIRITFPARDLEVSPLEEIDVAATVWDDFGLARIGLTWELAGREPVEVVLAERAAPRSQHAVQHVIRLEEAGVQPDDLVAYHVWAEDHGPDGSLRRTQSDLFFAEVRPFEEIFRQGEPPPGGANNARAPQGQNAQQAEELVELQKQILNATWKVIRRETGSRPSDAFAADVEQIRLSQAAALEQAGALLTRLQDPQSQEHAAAVVAAMEQAVAQLGNSVQQRSPTLLRPAQQAEQAAYQALLRLRAREHQVVRQNQRQMQGGRSSARSAQQRQQMQQLELRQDENRYETQRQAQDLRESPQQRENRQILNRLKELAQRQQDLNQRLKELQAALEEARTPQQREELARQLKRLQDEQRQILQDTEELQARMESPENLERMAAERQQLEQTREQVQRAAEALEQTRITQAAASGTRAEQSFQELRDEFRRRTSSRFRDQMQDLRQAAQTLQEQQQDLAQRLAQAAAPTSPQAGKSLRDSDQRQRLAQDLDQQRQRLATLQEQMRRTVEEAEATEPLLAERLYEALRTAEDQGVDRALQSVQRSLESGLMTDAVQQEQPAGRGIRQLREGIDRAAEAVLGDETEALRRAREELDQLAEQLQREIQRHAPQLTQNPRTGAPQPPSEAPSQTPGAPQEAADSAQDRAAPGGDAAPQENPSRQTPDEAASRSAPGGDRPQTSDRTTQPPQPRRGDVSPPEGSPRPDQPGEQPPSAEDRQRTAAPARGTPGQASRGERTAPQRGQRLSGPTPAGPRLNAGTGPFDDYLPERSDPLTGEGFREWSDRLRDVEEIVSDPQLRAEAARLRERARLLRADFKRHSREPNWELVQVQLAGPLLELRDRVALELLRRTAQQAIVPLDRDPVPPRFQEKTRRYYEQLGSGRVGSGP
jgi:hypothetical protein